MGVRARVAGTLTRAGRALAGPDAEPLTGPGPEAMHRAAVDESRMDFGSPFAPGEPIRPHEGYSRTPRTQDFVSGYNISARPRIHEQVSFETLKGLIGSYDVASLCCVPGTEIITKRGLIPIESVRVGDEVVTHLGRWRRVTETMVNQPQSPVRTLKTSAFEDLSVTGNHPVYAVDYRVTQSNKRVARGIGWTSADQLRPQHAKDGNRDFSGIVLPVMGFARGRPWLDIAAVMGGEYTTDRDGMLVRTRGGRLTRVPARVRMDAALGRMLGWYLAEGSGGKGRACFFSLAASETGYAEQILADAEAVFGLTGNIQPTPEGTGLTVRISSTVLGSLFSCGKARTKRLPEWAWAGGREFFAALLEAWALGDGSRNAHNDRYAPRITVATASRDLAWQMRMIAIAFGLGATVITRRGCDKYVAVIRGKRITTSPVQYCVTWREKPKRWGRESFEFDGRYLSTALVSASPADYDGPVYNLEVEEDHSYVTTGGTVHNCIWHRIDSLRSLDWKLISADGYSGDIEDAVERGMAVLRKPDRVNSFETWFAKWAYDILAYDAGCLYRMRNRAGRCVGLLPVDGTLVAPLLDYWGMPPEPPAEAYVQYAAGLPWNWLTRGDLIYEPFRPRASSPYGTAPIESVILTANTDLRFQVHFLSRFTEGNVPEAFASAPESWTPDQIEAWQELWDSAMYGDQARKHQIRWMPGGSTIAWTNEQDFSDVFSLFLMRKTCSAFHIVPTDLGFTENSNYSTGESQADVGHRVGDLPLGRYCERILTSFLQDDLGLPLKYQFDWGEEQDDRLNQAQADQLMIDRAVVSASEVRPMRYGLAEPAGQVVPRVFFTARGGPIPLSALYGVAGKIDPETAAPDPGTPLPHEAFTAVEGVLPQPPMKATPLAEQEYGPSAIPPAPAGQQPGTVVATDPGHLVAKEAAGATAGITTGTGVTSYDLIGRDDDEDDEARIRAAGDQVTKAKAAVAELAAFQRFARARRRSGQWRDFQFTAAGRVQAHNLNDAGRLAVRKAAGEIAVAGLAVQAQDTGRVLMLQRALDPDDPAGGMLEFPGGHLEGDEKPIVAAAREWSEETGCILPFDPDAMAALAFGQGAGWVSGIYAGFVYPVPSEDCVPVRSGALVTNPDDPDGDAIEAILWMDPAQLAGNPAVRPELAASLPDVLAALGCGEPSGEPVAKAGSTGPKAPAPAGAPNSPPAQSPPAQQPAPQAWPGWQQDLATIAYWVPLLTAALALIGAVELAEAWLALALTSAKGRQEDRVAELTAAAREWLASTGTADAITAAIAGVVPGTVADGYAIGGAAARVVIAGLGSIEAELGGWEPGATEIARMLAGEAGDGKGLTRLLDKAGVTIKSIADTELDRLARTLAIGSVRGSTAEELAAVISEFLADPSRAEMIVGTELARAANAAAVANYRRAGVEMVIVIGPEDEKTCPECDAEMAVGPRPLADAPDLPLHPRCRHVLAPA
jgi:8-oxo-dGTP pyrophosphatase MutT (NUDIX family)